MSQNLATPQQIMIQLEAVKKELTEHFKKDNASSRWEKVFIPIISIIVVGLTGIAGIFTNYWTQKDATQANIRTSQYEVTFNAKLQGYANLMATMQTSFLNSIDGKRDETINTDKLPAIFYSIEPFISTQAMRDQLWSDLQEMIRIITKVYETKGTDRALIDGYIQKRDAFGQKLRSELFSNKSP